jgi:outer membrane protein TolC
VRAAWLRLSAADWAVGAGQADRLPRLTLSADAAYSGQPGLLFANWLTSLVAGLTAPLFDGGRRADEVERLRAVAQEAAQAYAKVVATAVGEVQDALVNEMRRNEHFGRLTEQLSGARASRAEARVGYLNGRDDFLRFLTSHKNVQSLERRLVQQHAALLRCRIALHRALGGDVSEGWRP